MKQRVLIDGLTSLHHHIVRLIILTSDTFVVTVSAIISIFVLTGSDAFSSLSVAAAFFLILGAATVTTVLSFRLNQIKLVMFNSRDVVKIARAVVALTVIYIVLCYILNVNIYNIQIFVFFVHCFAGMVAARALAAVILGRFRDQFHRGIPIAIFGAGGAGVQLASVLRQSETVRPVLFFDDNPFLQGMDLGGIPVAAPKHLAQRCADAKIEKIIIALPEVAFEREKAIIEQCSRLDIDVQVVPAMVDILASRGSSSGEINVINPNDILGRGKVDLEISEIARSYAGRVVMVTGAGGSIGAELCRQMLHCRPSKIVLFERSEFNLYTIDQDIKPLAQLRGVKIVPCLGSVTDATRVTEVIRSEGVDIILHAAAYKHVPLVEANELEGARNNVLGTKTLADAASRMGIERFILISTDKAVRPTNIMGATKRLAELIIQDVQTRTTATKFSMVRFGNVLGSSGSVLPLFLTQIEAGGPITVTHPDVKRYFMTVAEASRLVLLAGAYSEGGDVFVLDMGKPQRIMDVAKKLVHLSGRSVKNPKTGEGDIAIEVTGLRPGEKLYEELLIDRDNLIKTPHVKILRAEENAISEIQIAAMLREVQKCIDASDPVGLRAVIAGRVDGYHVQKAPAIG